MIQHQDFDMCDEFQCFKAHRAFAEVYSIVYELTHSFTAILLPVSRVCGWLWQHLYLPGRLACITVITLCIKLMIGCFLKLILLLLLWCEVIAIFLNQFVLADDNLCQLENYLWFNIQNGWRSFAQKILRHPVCSVGAQKSGKLLKNCCCWPDDPAISKMWLTVTVTLPQGACWAWFWPSVPSLWWESCSIHGKGVLEKPGNKTAEQTLTSLPLRCAGVYSI